MSKGTESHETVFDDFTQVTWLEYSKMLDAHERAAWLEGYLAAKREALKDFIDQSRQVEKGE